MRLGFVGTGNITVAIITSLLAPYYALLETVVQWAQTQNIDPRDATTYTSSMFGALSVIAESMVEGDLATLKTECMTPGGLNDLAMKTIDSQGGFDTIRSALEAVRNR